MDEAEKLTENSAAGETIAYLRAIYTELSGHSRGQYLRFDLGLVNRLDYYTGLVFRGYVEGAGSTVLAGGRYDGLIGCFGADLPATGFAVYVDALAACLPEVEQSRPECLVYYGRGHLAQALAYMDSHAGKAELSTFDSLEASMAHAREKGMKCLVILDDQGEREAAL